MRQPWGIKLEMQHAPGSAFVDGEMIRGIKEHLFAVLRDIVYIANEIVERRFDLEDSASITNAVFRILRNARIARPQGPPRPRGVLGRALDPRARNTTTPSRSATSWACAGSTSAPAAARAR